MSSLKNLSNSGGGSSPSMTEMQIMQTLTTAQNHNVEEIGHLADAQISFTHVEEAAGQVSAAKVQDNISNLEDQANLSAILGVVMTVAGAFAGAGTSLGTLGVSAEAGLTAVETTSNIIGNGVAPVAEGGLMIAQSKISEQTGENKADASVAGNLMKGLEAVSKDSSSTISTTIQDNAQITGKEQSIISDDRQSKMYN